MLVLGWIANGVAFFVTDMLVAGVVACAFLQPETLRYL